MALAREHDASGSLTALRSAVDYVASQPLPLITRVVEMVVHGEDIRRPSGIDHAYSARWSAEAVAYLLRERPSGGKSASRASL